MELAQSALALVEQLAASIAILNNEAVMAAVLLIVTTGAIGLCVPGLLVPISLSAGMLLDGWLAVAVVAAGAVLGSHALFVAGRRGLGGAVERRLAGRLDRFLPHVERHGFFYVAGLRVIGTPHALVTLASAASPLRHGSFALASLLGFLPSIILSAGVGTAI